MNLEDRDPFYRAGLSLGDAVDRRDTVPVGDESNLRHQWSLRRAACQHEPGTDLSGPAGVTARGCRLPRACATTRRPAWVSNISRFHASASSWTLPLSVNTGDSEVMSWPSVRSRQAFLRRGRSTRPSRSTLTRTGSGLLLEVLEAMQAAGVEDRVRTAAQTIWEGDLIMGSKSSETAVGTLVERTTGFVMLLHLPNGHGTLAVQKALVAKMLTLDEQLRRSLTWDQGLEMASHREIAEATGLEIYSETRTRRGSAARTRTPTGCYASTYPKAAISRSTAPACSTTSRPSSTHDHASDTGFGPPRRGSRRY